MQKIFHNGIKVIINADDFGYCEERDQGIIYLVKEGCLSSISVMVNGSNIKRSSKILMETINQNFNNNHFSQHLSIGLHLNLTQFHKISNKTISNPLLYDQSGYFKGKPHFYEHIQNIITSASALEYIEEQIKCQIEHFQRIFGFRPSHIDGHNHIHVIPEIAIILIKVLPFYGLYNIRLPIPFQLNDKQGPLAVMNHRFMQNAIKSKELFEKQGFVFPAYLIGLENMGAKFNTQEIINQIKKIQEFRSENNVDTYIEIMVHPGYPQLQSIDSKVPLCPFSANKQRQHQLNTLKSEQFKEKIKKVSTDGRLWTYNHITIHKPNNSALIYSKLTQGTGNRTTSIRLTSILRSIGFEQVYLLNVPEKSSDFQQKLKVQRMIKQLKLKFVIGINLTKTARIIYESMKFENNCPVKYKVPYMLMIAGTDANITLSKTNENTSEKMRLIEPIKQCLCLISLTEELKMKTEEFLHQNLLKKESHIIAQSSGINHICPKNQDTSCSDRSYILFPTSFRPVKGVSHLFLELNQIIQSRNIDVYIYGPIINQKYYLESIKDIGKIKYMGTISHEKYLQYLKGAYLVINCSQSEGMSCSILEALAYGVPVIARDNEGNRALIDHKINGFLYHHGSDFLTTFNHLYQNYESISKELTTNYREKLESNPFETERSKYQCLFKENYQPYQLQMDDVFLISIPKVHPISHINLKIMKKIFSQQQADTSLTSPHRNGTIFLDDFFINRFQQQSLNEINILDLGCGCGIFAIFFMHNLVKRFHEYDHMKKGVKLHINLYFSDVMVDALQNTLANIQEFAAFIDNPKHRKCISFKSYGVYEGSMFNCFGQQYHNKFDIILANLPQTPFRNIQSRIDKNAGGDSLRWHREFLQQQHLYLKKDKQCFSVVLYSHMAQPKAYIEIAKSNHNQIVWISSPQTHIIEGSSYDAMQQGLANYIRQFYQQGKAQINIINNIFHVPADLRVIQVQPHPDHSEH